MNLHDTVRAAVAEGRLGSRVWMYANYHCNLTCGYCLTESGPAVARRELDPDVMRGIVAQAADLGFGGVGVTGGEPFLRRDLPALLGELSATLPVICLTNGTLFSGDRISRLDPLAGRDVTLQISLDAADPVGNDPMRGPENFARVIDAVPRILERGVRVRIGTTRYGQTDEEIARVAALVARLGVPPEDHVIRPTVNRGRAGDRGLGERVGFTDLPPEVTFTVDGVFWSPFGPTVRGGRLDTDLLVSRRVLPVETGVRAFVGLVTGTPLAEAGRFT